MPERVLRHVWSAVGSREGKTATCLGKGTRKPGAPQFQGASFSLSFQRNGHPYFEDLFTEERGYLATVGKHAAWESRSAVCTVLTEPHGSIPLSTEGHRGLCDPDPPHGEVGRHEEIHGTGFCKSTQHKPDKRFC